MKFKKYLKFLITGFGFWFLAHTSIIVIDGLTDENIKTEVGVILGNKVNADGSLSNRLKSRMDRGIELYKDSLIALVFVSGGRGVEGYDEGTKMAEYLIENGIPIKDIVIDNKGITTEVTAKNLKAFNTNYKSVTVISQYFHISRTKLAMRKQGFKIVYGAHPDYFEVLDIYSLVREFFAYYKYLLTV